MSQSEFERLQAALQQGGVDAALEQLAAELLKGKQHRALFSARQMQVRHRLGLPVIDMGSLGDTLEEPIRSQLEDGYVAACREVGKLLLDEGQLREAWMFLQISGDKDIVKAALLNAEANDTNVAELIEVALYEGVWPQRGIELILRNYGTCNTITTLDAELHNLPRPDRMAAVGMLVRHIHEELLANVRADIARQEGAEPAERTLAALVAQRDWLLAEGNYHIDTTHLAATVRFARALEEPETLRLAMDLADYGSKLHRQFQSEGDEPFVDLYASHALLLGALVGEQVEEALTYFRGRAEQIDIEEAGTSAAEVYISLLARLGRCDEALDAAVRLIPRDVQTTGIAPDLLELARKAGRYDRLMAVCRERGDLVGFAAGLVGERMGVR